MAKGPQGIWDSDPSLTWLTPTLAILLLSPLSTQSTPCLPQLGNMPQAPAQAHCLRLPLIQAAALPTGINVTCIPAHRAQGPLCTSADFYTGNYEGAAF